MAGIPEDDARRVILDARPGRYPCFPDVAWIPDGTPNGRLVLAYNDYDRHVATERNTVVRTSHDLGRTWSEPRLLSDKGHCPRLAFIKNHLLLLDFNGRMLHVSEDAGDSWKSTFTPRADQYVIFDRPLEQDPESAESLLLSAAQVHLAQEPQPTMSQSRTVVTAFVSANQGKSWQPHAVIAAHENLALCEGSITRLHNPGARLDGQTLVCLMRENNMVFEPMYASLSKDNGSTWSEPVPTPLQGHRPTLGLLPDDHGWSEHGWGGRLLVTYRDVGPDPGTSAWAGSLDELLSGFQVHGPAEELDGHCCLRLTGNGLEMFNLPGPHWPPRYALRPLTDPRRATAVLSAELDASNAGPWGCRIRFAGASVRIFPHRLELQAGLPGNGTDPKPVRRKLSPGPLSLRLEYEPGLVTLRMPGRQRARVAVDPEDVRTRPILFGAALTRNGDKGEAPGANLGANQDTDLGSHLWRAVSLRTTEPRLERAYAWDWRFEQGLPDAWKRSRVLELDKSRGVSIGDFGYTGWTVLPDGRIFCVYHHADPSAGEYKPGETTQLRGVWLQPGDLP